MHPQVWASAGGQRRSDSAGGATQRLPVAPSQWPQHRPVSLHTPVPSRQDHPRGAQPPARDVVRKTGLVAVCLSRQRFSTSARYTVRLPIYFIVFFPFYCITNAWTLPPYRKAALFVHTCDFPKKKKNCNNSPARCEKLHSFVGL